MTEEQIEQPADVDPIPEQSDVDAVVEDVKKKEEVKEEKSDEFDFDELSKLAEAKENMPKADKKELEAKAQEPNITIKKEYPENVFLAISGTNLSIFRDLLENLIKTNNEGEIIFEEDFVKIHLMDIAKVYMLELDIFNSFFDYVKKPDINVSLVFTDLYNLIKRGNPNELQLYFNKDSELIAKVKAKFNKEQNIPMLSEVTHTPKFKELNWDVTVLTKLKLFKDLVDEMLSFYGKEDYPKISFVVKSKKLYAFTIKDTKKRKYDLKMDVETDKDFISKYNLQYIQKFMSMDKLCENSEIIFGQDIPMLLKFTSTNKFVMRGVIAPMVDND